MTTDFDNAPRTGNAAAQAAATSGSKQAIAQTLEKKDAATKAYEDNHPRTAAEASAKVSGELARRQGFTDDSAPLGDPDAPQGSGPEMDMSQPHNRPAPLGKIRTSHAESGDDHQ